MGSSSSSCLETLYSTSFHPFIHRPFSVHVQTSQSCLSNLICPSDASFLILDESSQNLNSATYSSARSPLLLTFPPQAFLQPSSLICHLHHSSTPDGTPSNLLFTCWYISISILSPSDLLHILSAKSPFLRTSTLVFLHHKFSTVLLPPSQHSLFTH